MIIKMRKILRKHRMQMMLGRKMIDGNNEDDGHGDVKESEDENAYRDRNYSKHTATNNMNTALLSSLNFSTDQLMVKSIAYTATLGDC